MLNYQDLINDLINSNYLIQVFHYAQELFEGMKAYRGADDQVNF
jgi:branched-subunit amino acid aminotransferase/4-amino-4-deoxychorismate lyase